ncbi:MAG: FkbM family methyltransferase [Terriglobia bacterium]
MVSEATPGSTVLDVGAHVGHHTGYVLQHRKDVSVIAFEANPDLARDLSRTFAREIGEARLTVRNVAVGTEAKEVEFFVSKKDTGYSGLKPRPSVPQAGSSFEVVRVQQLALDDLLPQLTKPVSVLKIDVEGAELDALCGGGRLIRECRPLVLFECCNNAAIFYGNALCDLVCWFESSDYKVLTIHGVNVTAESSDAIFRSGVCWEFVAVPRERAEELSHAVREGWQKVLKRDDRLFGA